MRVGRGGNRPVAGVKVVLMAVLVAVLIASCGGDRGAVTRAEAEEITFGTVSNGDDESADQDDTDPAPSADNEAPDDQPADDEPTEDEPADDDGTLPLDQWGDEMDEICRLADVEMAMLAMQGEEHGAALIKGWQQRIDGMRALPRPAGHEQTAEELLVLLDDIVKRMEEPSDTTTLMVELADPESELGAPLTALSEELGIADCGQGEQQGNDLCDLVSDEMVTAVIGEPAPTPEGGDQLSAHGCTWRGDDVDFAVQSGAASIYSQAMDFARESGKPVAGLGDEALLVPGYSSITGGNTRGATLWVLEGETVIAVGGRVGFDPVGGDKLRTVAEHLLANL